MYSVHSVCVVSDAEVWLRVCASVVCGVDYGMGATPNHPSASALPNQRPPSRDQAAARASKPNGASFDAGRHDVDTSRKHLEQRKQRRGISCRRKQTSTGKPLLENCTAACPGMQCVEMPLPPHPTAATTVTTVTKAAARPTTRVAVSPFHHLDLAASVALSFN